MSKHPTIILQSLIRTINYNSAIIPTIPLEQIENSEVRDFIYCPKDEETHIQY